MTVMGRRAMGRRAAEREQAEHDELTELVEGIVADLLPQLIVSCLSDPQVIRALRAALSGRAAVGPPPLRAAEVKARRRS